MYMSKSLPLKSFFSTTAYNMYILGQKKKICMFQVSAMKKLGMVGRHNILFS